MKPNEIRNLSEDEIHDEVAKRRQELLDLRFQAAVGQVGNPRRIRAAKREIARLLTIATEKTGSSKKARVAGRASGSGQARGAKR